MHLPSAFFLGSLVAIGLCFGTAARAQQAPLLNDEPNILQSLYTSVLERPQPGYDAIGIPLGAFTLSPAVSISTIYDDNIFGRDAAKSSDVFARIEPSVNLTSHSDRYDFFLRGRATVDRYATYSSEDVADYVLASVGTIDLASSTQLSAAVQVDSAHQSRLSQDLYATTVRPVRYDEQSGAVRISHAFQRLRLSANAQVSRINYDNGLLPDGTVYDQQGSDSSGSRFGVRATYQQSSALAWFVGGNAYTRDYRTATATTPKRDYRGSQVVAGAVFDTASLVRGTVAIGYLSQNFRSPFFRDIHGLTVDANVEWFPTQLTTVTVRAHRAVVDAGIPLSSGYLTSVGGLQVDHELLRQLILSGSVEYARNNFNNIDRIDGRLTTGARATCRVNRHADLNLRYDRIGQTSHGADRYRPFVDNRLQLSLTLRG